MENMIKRFEMPGREQPFPLAEIKTLANVSQPSFLHAKRCYNRELITQWIHVRLLYCGGIVNEDR
jgi:hypothetical protein